MTTLHRGNKAEAAQVVELLLTRALDKLDDAKGGG